MNRFNAYIFWSSELLVLRNGSIFIHSSLFVNVVPIHTPINIVNGSIINANVTQINNIQLNTCILSVLIEFTPNFHLIYRWQGRPFVPLVFVTLSIRLSVFRVSTKSHNVLTLKFLFDIVRLFYILFHRCFSFIDWAHV